jgi:hypothetical protein
VRTAGSAPTSSPEHGPTDTNPNSRKGWTNYRDPLSTNCGKYQVHEDLKTVPTDDGGTERLCPDCWDGSTAKAIYQAQWRDAVVQMDEGNRMARHSIHLRQQFVLGIGALSLRPELFGSYSGHRWQWNFDAASV